MACKISWTARAWKTYEANIAYLQEAWTDKEIKTFIILVEKKIANIALNPKLGWIKGKSSPNIRCTLVHKRVLLIYRYKPIQKKIELLVFWNTSQNPWRLKI